MATPPDPALLKTSLGVGKVVPFHQPAIMDAMVAKAPADPDTLVEDVEHLSISPYGPARSSITEHPLSEDEVRKMTDYFHASLYMCLGMIYLRRNPLLRDPLTLDHLKRRLLGHWGSDAGQSFTYIHMVRTIARVRILGGANKMRRTVSSRSTIWMPSSSLALAMAHPLFSQTVFWKESTLRSTPTRAKMKRA